MIRHPSSCRNPDIDKKHIVQTFENHKTKIVSQNCLSNLEQLRITILLRFIKCLQKSVDAENIHRIDVIPGRSFRN